MTRGGVDKMREDPERRCVVTGEVQPKAGLVRFVLSPEGIIFPDLANKLPGRGIWVTASRDLIAKAAAKGLFSRGAKAPARAPDDLVAQVEVNIVLAMFLLDEQGGTARDSVVGILEQVAALIAGM